MADMAGMLETAYEHAPLLHPQMPFSAAVQHEVDKSGVSVKTQFSRLS